MKGEQLDGMYHGSSSFFCFFMMIFIFLHETVIIVSGRYLTYETQQKNNNDYSGSDLLPCSGGSRALSE